ncbi:MAG: SemiSWEET family transporter [Acidimicrobiales bacterium]
MFAAAAALFGIVMGLAPLFQVARMMRLRSSADVSLAYVAVLVVGFGFFLAYGVALRNLVLVVSYSVSLAVGCVNLAVIGYLRALAPSRRGPKRP